MDVILYSEVNDETVEVHVTKCDYIKPDHSTWSSDIDYNGGYDIEFSVHNSDGDLLWINDNSYSRIEQEIIDWYNS